jgi:NCAIR mutase (PurE)-related protein
VSGVDRDAARALLTAVAGGSVDVEAALGQLVAGPFEGYQDLGFARVDTHRALRTSDPEVVYGAGKTPEQAAAILRSLHTAHPDRAVLLTRADAELRAGTIGLLDAPAAAVTEEPVANCLAVGPLPPPVGRVVVVSAGTSDLPVAAEAAFVARVGGAGVEQISDVGVAGLHRLLAVRTVLDEADCVVVVAGMDGALPSAVGGLIGVPLVAVPTSVGYGAAFGGLAALLSMLNSCAPGVTVTNIDNGFGAGFFAARVARRAHQAGPS